MNEYVTIVYEINTFTDALGRTFEIRGLDIAERAKKYQAEKGCNYETALLQVSKKEGE